MEGQKTLYGEILLPKKKKDILGQLIQIQSAFDDDVLFKVGIRKNGKIDLVSAENMFSGEHVGEVEVKLPEAPDYVG